MAPCQVKEFQSREGNDEELVEEYVENLKSGVQFPPGSAVFDPETGVLYLVDGIHRALAYEKADRSEFPVTIKIGTEVDALLASSGSNASHGKKRSNKDKEHAVMLVLRHPELCRFSNNRLAKEAKVSPQLVDRVREMLENDPNNPIRSSGNRLAVRNGKTYKVSAPPKATAATKASAETPEIALANAVKRIIDRVSKESQKLPVEIRDIFAEELQHDLHDFFSTETMGS